MQTKNPQPPLPSKLNRLMPQATDAEKVIIHEMLFNNAAIPLVEDRIAPSDFYSPKNGTVYTACLQLYSRQDPVNLIALAEELKRMEKLEILGGIPALTEFISADYHCLNRIEFYASIVKQKSMSRKLIEICMDTMNRCFEETTDIADILEQMEMEFTRLNNEMDSTEALPMEKAVDLTVEQIRNAAEDHKKGIVNGVPTHLQSLTDAHGGGFKAPELIVLGARPSMGKTQHALEIALAAGMNGCNTLFCSLEMNTNQLVKRLLLRDERIPEVNIHNGELNAEEFIYLDESAGAIRPAKIFFADNHNIRNLPNIKKEARRLKRKAKIKFLIVDYLGLIKTGLTFSLRTQEIAYITGELKALAKELDIAVLLLSQLSRPPKGEKARIPVMEDLRESGDIEQDADIVLLLHKPDYYDPEKLDKEGVAWKNRGVLIRAKHREGERNVNFIFSHDARYKKIYDYLPEKKSKGIPLPPPTPPEKTQRQKPDKNSDNMNHVFDV